MSETDTAKKSGDRLKQAAGYLFGLPGGLLVMLASGTNPGNRYHGYNSVAVNVIGLVVMAAWAVAQYILSWVPYAGFLLGILVSTLMAAFWIFILISLLGCTIGSLMGRDVKIPFFHRFINNIWKRLPSSFTGE